MAESDHTSGNRVFISCVSDEFEKKEAPFPDLRSDLRGHLSRADCEVKVQEDFRQEGKRDTVEKLDAYIRRSAAVIHLVGEKPGSTAHHEAVKGYLKAEPDFLKDWPDLRDAIGDCSDLTYTQWEAFIALHREIPLFVYATDKAKTGQETHIARLELGRRYAEAISGIADLFGKLIGDIHSVIPAVPKLDRNIAPSRLLRHAAKHLFGREEWLEALNAAWNSGDGDSDSVNVYTLVAWGGSGKTALVAHWIANHLAKRGWPGVERYFDWSFYSQGSREQSQASADFFIAAALAFFGDPDPQIGSPWERGQRLAGLVRQHRTLLVLDGIEPLQYPPASPQAGELKDEALAALLAGLAMDYPGLCVVTTRESLKNLEPYRDGTAPEKPLNQLTREAAIALLRHLEIEGTDAEIEAAWKSAGGHALTLQLLGRFLADAHGRDIRKWREVKFEEADRETAGRTAMKVMEAYENWLESAGPERQRDLAVLRLMGLFDRPADGACLAALRAEPAIPGLTEEIVTLKDWQWRKALTDLESLDLVTVIEGESKIQDPTSNSSIDAHPLVREYFAVQLRDRHPDAFRAAHSRLFAYLCETTEPRPDTLEDLQPLYQAVAHGCLAGRQQEACDKVFVDRIRRGAEAFSQRKLGAIGADLGAVAAFFEEPWSRLSPNLGEADQAWLLNEAAFSLRALGRLTEALEPMRIGLEKRIEQKVWKSAAIIASNLSELEATLGRLGEAVGDGRRAIGFADRSGDVFQRGVNRRTTADALHQSGERAEARALFEETERMQAEAQPQYPLLYGLAGFRYSDLILAPAERAAWRRLLNGGRCAVSAEASDGTGETRRKGSNAESGDTNPAGDGALTAQRPPTDREALEACAEAARRATQTLEWVTGKLGLLTIALDHLTLARAGLYRAILSSPAAGSAPESDSSLNPETFPSETSEALRGLRKAGQSFLLCNGLLTAALSETVDAGMRNAESSSSEPIGLPPSALDHLAEAQQIAKRGPMPLYLADVHLHRARLTRDRKELAKARELIETHGYWRRREELEDAEAAAKNW